MPRQITKEQAVFLVGAALFIWVAIKLALFVTHQSSPPGPPRVQPPAATPGDGAIGDLLATPGLDGYDRGSSDVFIESNLPPQLFIRSFIAHSFMRATGTAGCSLISSYSFECRMAPNPIPELRFTLPAGLNVVAVFSKESDAERKWGVDGKTLIVPIKPTLIKRGYYGCRIDVKAQNPVAAPSVWTAPVLACGSATENVLSESGTIAIATPNDQVEILAKDVTQANLTRLALEQVPKELAFGSNKLAYTYRQPNYTLTLEIKPPATTVTSIPTKSTVGPVVKPTQGPVVKPTKGPEITKGTDTKGEEPPTEKIAFPKAGDAESLPFKLAMIVKLEEPEPRRQAVLRNKDTQEYLRKFEGDLVMNDLSVESITDDAVIVKDSKGRIYRFQGRFEDKYNTTAPKDAGPTKKGGPPGKTRGG